MHKVKLAINLDVDEGKDIKEVEKSIDDLLVEMEYLLSKHGKCSIKFDIESPVQVNIITNIEKVGGKDGSNQEDSNKG